MGTFPRHSGLFVFGAIATTAVVLMALMGWPQPNRAIEFSGLIVAAIVTSVLAVQRPVAEDRGMMPLAFVINFQSSLAFFVGALFFWLMGVGRAPKPAARPSFFAENHEPICAGMIAGAALMGIADAVAAAFLL